MPFCAYNDSEELQKEIFVDFNSNKACPHKIDENIDHSISTAQRDFKNWWRDLILSCDFFEMLK